MKVQANEEQIHSNGTQHFLVHANDMLWAENVHML
jgi:hypothetical protein